MAGSNCPECQGWKTKYDASEKELKFVKNLANKAVIEHEDFFAKYTENKKQYDELCEVLRKKDQDIERLRSIIEPFVADFRELEVKAEIQAALREDAENYARKAHKQYMNIKRKSLNMCHQFNLSTTAIDIDIDAEPEAGTDSDVDVSGLEERIKDLEQTIFDFANELDRAKEDRDDAICNAKTLADECNSLKRQKQEVTNELSSIQQMTDSFKRVSFLALEEITDWKDKYDVEKKLREETLKIAQGFQREKTAIQHQSQAVMASAFSDVQLRNALLKLEDLTRENEMMKQQYGTKIEKLQAKCSESNTLEKTVHLERCIEVNEIEMEGLRKDIEDQRKKIDALDYDKRCLQERLDMEIKKSSAPPPPPPPPPPPVKVPIAFSIFRHKKKAQGAAGAAAAGPNKAAVKGNESYDKALDELMKRIKQRAQNQEPSADLDALINKDKKRNSRVDEINNVLHQLAVRPSPARRPERESPAPEMSEFDRKMTERRKKSNAGISQEGNADQ